MSSSRFIPTPGTIADRLRRRLLGLDFPAFARCACVLLEAIGYEDARPAGRREWKGYNRPGGGGYDLDAALPGGLTPRRVVAQIKQFDQLAVHQRSVDELRGACLRAGAAEALLVTTSAFSAVVRKQAAAPNPSGALVAPVRLIDGQELLGLLIRHRLGVRENIDVHAGLRSGMRHLEIDEAFFRKLAAHSIPADTVNTIVPAEAAPRPPYGSAPLTWSVTVRISGSRDGMRGGKGRGRNPGTDGSDRGTYDRKGGG